MLDLKTFTTAVGLMGAGATGVYLVGYAVLAAHHRVLGLPMRATDVPTLVSAAWEFGYRGLLIVTFDLVSFRPLGAAAMAAAALAVILARAAPIGTHHRLRSVLGTARHVVMIDGLGLALALWRLFWVVLPVCSVAALLAIPAPILPVPHRFQLQRLFDDRAGDIRTALLGDGLRSDYSFLAGLFSSQVAAVALLGVLVVLSRRLHRESRASRLHRLQSRVVTGLTIVNAVFIPLAYGALLKSYRYPRVEVHAKTSQTLAEEYADLAATPRFLLETTDDAYFLYSPKANDVAIIRREDVGLVKIMADDFIFQGSQHPK